jgi:hypothetical protein
VGYPRSSDIQRQSSFRLFRSKNQEGSNYNRHAIISFIRQPEVTINPSSWIQKPILARHPGNRTSSGTQNEIVRHNKFRSNLDQPPARLYVLLRRNFHKNVSIKLKINNNL